MPEAVTATLAEPGSQWHARVFAGNVAQVPEARGFVAGALAGCPDEARDALLLCVTELCANAIEHTASGAGGAFMVEVFRPLDGMARITVTDGGGPGEPRAHPPEPGAEGDDEGGRGLALVAAFSSQWGYAATVGNGRMVWAETSWPVKGSPSAIPCQGIWEDIDASGMPRGAA